MHRCTWVRCASGNFENFHATYTALRKRGATKLAKRYKKERNPNRNRNLGLYSIGARIGKGDSLQYLGEESSLVPYPGTET